jgi:hypothetical protein
MGLVCIVIELLVLGTVPGFCELVGGWGQSHIYSWRVIDVTRFSRVRLFLQLIGSNGYSGSTCMGLWHRR